MNAALNTLPELCEPETQGISSLQVTYSHCRVTSKNLFLQRFRSPEVKSAHRGDIVILCCDAWVGGRTSTGGLILERWAFSCNAFGARLWRVDALVGTWRVRPSDC